MTFCGRAVVLAYYFPPLIGIASDRAASLTTEFENLGWGPIVITARDGFYHRSAHADREHGSVIRTRSLELSRAVRRAHAVATWGTGSDRSPELRPVRAGRLGAHMRRFLREFVYVPDAQIGWIPFAYASACRALTERSGTSVLFSTSVPYSAHLAAMAAARRCRTPWVAEFRDPWSTAEWPNRPESNIRQKVDRALERLIVTRADHVVMTAESTRSQLLDVHPSLAPDRVSVVTNGFVPMRDRRRPESGDAMTIVYAGTVAPGESTSFVLSELDHVHARHPGAFRLRVFGPTEAWQQPGAGAHHRPWLEFSGIVTPAQARAAVLEGSALLLIQRAQAYHAVLPGKAFEYIGARRPILALIPQGRELHRLLRTHADLRLIDSERPGVLSGAVDGLLAEHSAGTLQKPRVSLDLTRPLRRSEQAKKLARIFADVSQHGTERLP